MLLTCVEKPQMNSASSSASGDLEYFYHFFIKTQLAFTRKEPHPSPLLPPSSAWPEACRVE